MTVEPLAEALRYDSAHMILATRISPDLIIRNALSLPAGSTGIISSSSGHRSVGFSPESIQSHGSGNCPHSPLFVKRFYDSIGISEPEHFREREGGSVMPWLWSKFRL